MKNRKGRRGTRVVVLDRCEYQYRTQEWPYSHRCTNTATAAVYVDGDRFKVCETHKREVDGGGDID